MPTFPGRRRPGQDWLIFSGLQQRLLSSIAAFKKTLSVHQQTLRAGIVPLDYPDLVAADWPDLLAIVWERVKPSRDQDNREVRKRFWLQYAERAPALYEAIAPLNCVLVFSMSEKDWGLRS